jgi:hypothetical protein
MRKHVRKDETTDRNVQEGLHASLAQSKYTRYGMEQKRNIIQLPLVPPPVLEKVEGRR